MTDTWKKHCPYDNDEQPDFRQAWRDGWTYRREHGPIMPAKQIGRKMRKRLLHAFWLEGYNAADDHLAELQTEAGQ